MWFLYFSLLFIFLYSFLIIKYCIGWLRLKAYGDHKQVSNIYVDVLIPFRNEEKNIETLVKSLKNQKYPRNFVNYILIDDHSEDNSLCIAINLINGDDRFSILQLDSKKEGKKEALKKGLQKSSAEVILFSDADCYHNPLWIISMVNAYLLNNANIVLGPVVISRKKGFINKFAEFEYTGLTGVTAASAYYKKPVLCNGANLLVKRNLLKTEDDVFKRKYTSGDDLFILTTLKNKVNDGIIFQKSHDAIVLTNPPFKLNKFLSQRVRWVSKNKGIRDKDIFLNSLLVFLANLVLLTGFSLSFIEVKYFYFFLPCFFIKTIADLVFLKSVLSYFNKRDLLKFIVVFQFFNLIYVPIVAVWGSIGNFTWKNRKYKK